MQLQKTPPHFYKVFHFSNRKPYSSSNHLFLPIFSGLRLGATFLIITTLIFFVNSASANELKNHSSPYLALHGDDPVDWRKWGKPVLEQAKKENKLLFVSIGYFACHWCHVMQRESFADKGVAKKLNKNYISVKVDRELNPVLDKRLIEFVTVTNGTAGWPLNVFITPEGYPLVGATYLPREHFSNVLDQLSNKWKTENMALTKQAKEMSETLVSMLEKQERKVEGSIKDLADKYVDAAMEYADTLQGGFGQEQKFPQIPQLWGLLKLNQINKNEEADELIKLTLDQMATKGLHDELAGGFYRYTVDPSWEIPHFEKMLYTNALMPLLYFDAADFFNNSAYREVALETLYFLRNEMQGEKNAFIASLSAVDDKNEEGGFYLWTREELKKVLSEQELQLANQYWNLNRANELPAGNLPREAQSAADLAKQYGVEENAIKNNIQYLKTKLKQHRDKTRVLPRDDKLLSGQNGLALAAFARGIGYDPSLIETGEKLSQFLLSLWDGKTLRKSAANNDAGTLYDYAAVSWGLIKWGLTTNNEQIKQAALDITRIAWEKFYIDESWVEDPNSLLPEGQKQMHITDSALISPEALLLETSYLTNDKKLIDRADKTRNKLTRSLETDLYSYPSLLSLK